MSTPKPLHLRLEWNGKLKAGEELSPNFVMFGEDLDQLESISCILDPRLPQTYWDNSPTIDDREKPFWSFTERLSLQSAGESPLRGVFTIEFSVRFKYKNTEQGKIETVAYRTTIFLEVKDSSNAVTVKAKGSSLVRVRGNFDGPIIIEAEDDSTVDITPPLYQPNSSNQPNPASTSEMDLKPLLGKAMPPLVNDPILLLHAELPGGQERFYHLAARQRVILGRARNESIDETRFTQIKASDFVYRFCRTGKKYDEVAEYLSTRVSRNLLGITLSENGLDLENLGTETTGGQDKNIVNFTINKVEFRLDEKQPRGTIDLNSLNEEINIVLRRFSGLKLKKFSAQPEWCDRIEKILQNQIGLCDYERNPLWQIGTATGVNSIRLRRSPKHPVSDSVLAFLKNDILAMRDRNGLQKYPDPPMSSQSWTSDLMAYEEEYHIVIRMLTIGNDPMRDAICIDQNGIGMETRHATIYFCENHFGLIDHSSNAIDYQQYGMQDKLYQGECLPLQPGMKFKIGSVNFHIYESYSAYLDIQKQKGNN